MGDLKPVGITKAHLVKANIGEDYWTVDFTNFIGPISAKDSTKKYLRTFKEMKTQGIGLLFGGPPGPGKTTLAAIAVKYILRAGWSGYMTSLSELVEEIQKGWSGEESDVLERCRSCDFLLIDDLGKEHQGPTGFSANVFDNLIRYRTQHRLPTFITTNLTRSDIKARYGGSLLSLIEGKMHIVEVNDKDVRTEILKPRLKERFV